ncbi:MULTISPECIES: hypothetical protein [Streptomyces]|uniref:Uncharacterized protein n=1 Tax=Streptomyces akebiae TaxID=2865673 RepID=A0ABX8XKL6_9ACTN|nr:MULTISPECIES: hypothetical protein [Streptomyces]MCX5173849.1 hypothetical protein [Streptomyces antibioticus]QYX76147.1 hypothetical protein K1J60_06185 [Streptomyces akebiae]
MDEATQHAAWDIYVSLHNLAAAHVLGEVLTTVQNDQVILGDIDDALEQLNEHEAVLRLADAELLQRVRDAIATWNARPGSRLAEVLPLLDRLERILGLPSRPFSRPPRERHQRLLGRKGPVRVSRRAWTSSRCRCWTLPSRQIVTNRPSYDARRPNN